MRSRLSLAAALAATTATLVVTGLAALAAQQPAPPAVPTPPVTFRAEVNFVEVDALVTDAKGNLVTDLTQADFEVFEDGKPQTIANFSLVNLPATRPDQPLFAEAPIESDVQANTQVEGRVYLILLDSLHTDALNTARVKAAARQFIERRLSANDVAAVVHTGIRSDLGQDFTSNRRLLLAAVDRFVGEKLRSETLSRIDAYNRGGGAIEGNPSITRNNPVRSTQLGVMDPEEMERGQKARRMLSQLRRISDFLAGIRGRRKALVLISEGLTYDLSDPWSKMDSSLVIDDVRDAIGAATRGNVSIYAIDPRGLATGMADAIEVDGFVEDRALNVGLSAMQSEFIVSQNSLRTLAEETGGFAAVNRNDYKDVFDRLVRENSTYYVLGYYPPSSKRDGKYHKISVKVKRPGLQVRARKGYSAPRGKAASEKATNPLNLPVALREAMNSPLPVAGLPMRVFAAAFKGTAPNASVALSMEFPARDFRFTEEAGTFKNLLDVVITPVEQKGTVRPGKRSKATLGFKADVIEQVRANGVRVLSSLELPPGRYQLRVSASEEGTGRTGSVLYDLEVPDFAKQALSMSGVALTAQSAGNSPTMGSEGIIAPLMPAPTIATREFGRDDVLALFVEVYENQPGSQAHRMALSTTVRAADGRVAFQAKEDRSSTELQAGRGGYGYTPQIPLKDFTPGTYVIHVEARSTAGNEAGIGRDIQILVK